MEEKELLKKTDAAIMEETIDSEMQFPRPADFTEPQVLYEKLLNRIRKYHPSGDLSLIEKAYQTAYDAHKEQRRKSGEAYIVHPLNVALILAELELDKESIAAGLLHDAIEDTYMSYEDIQREFGEEVALIVDGVTKLTQINWGMDKEDIQAENLRKMFMAMAKDIRVILVKLADRLHNMRTSRYWSEEKQIEKARETMEIFAPVASRLGISKIKIELDDRSLAILHPDVFLEISKRLNLSSSDRTQFIADRIQEISECLEKEHVKGELSGRVKHLFSIYKKMVQKHATLDQIYDIFAIRILVDNVMECYAALGVVHEMYTPIPGRFKDYIAMPKPNMYQSLHTTVMGANGIPFEIQIRTHEMHKTAEFGIAAHWKYKEKGSGEQSMNSEEQKVSWLHSVMDWQKSNDSKSFVHLLKDDLDLFSSYVYCFTPNGEVKTLPAGSNPIDFAYMVHTAVGHRMVGAKVNGNLVPIDYQLQNGDRVEIMTSMNSRGPSMDWLKIVKSAQAKSKINQWFKTQNREENISRGRDMLAQYCRTKGIRQDDIMKPKYMEEAVRKYRYADWDSVLASIGHGGLKEGQIINKLLEEYKKDNQTQPTDEELLRNIAESSKSTSKSGKAGNGIIVKGLHDLSVRFSHCCNPVPGDEIVGYITRGRGISIHRTDCTNIMALPDSEKVRLMPAEWSQEEVNQSGAKYSATINIYCTNRIGMFADITRMMTENNVNIMMASSKADKQGNATISMTFEVTRVEELNQLISKLRMISGILDIERALG